MIKKAKAKGERNVTWSTKLDALGINMHQLYNLIRPAALGIASWWPPRSCSAMWRTYHLNNPEAWSSVCHPHNLQLQMLSLCFSPNLPVSKSDKSYLKWSNIIQHATGTSMALWPRYSEWHLHSSLKVGMAFLLRNAFVSMQMPSQRPKGWPKLFLGFTHEMFPTYL